MSTRGIAKHGNTVKISCESGHTPIPGEITLKCSNGSWENGQREWNKSQMNCNGEIIILLIILAGLSGF